MLAERDRAGLDDQVVERRHDLSLGGRGLDARPRFDGAAHVHLGREIEVRRGGLGLGHSPGDRLLELGQVLVGRGSLGRLRALARSGSRLGGHGRRWRGRRRAGARSPRRRGPCRHRPLDVRLDDPAARPRAGERFQVEPLLARDAACQRRGLDPPVPARRRRGRGLRRASPRGPRSVAASAAAFRFALCRGAVPGRLLSCLAHARDHLADRQGVSLLGEGLDQGAGGGRLVDHVGLVGLDLDQLLAERDLVAGRLHPAKDRALLHRVREPGHDDVLRHWTTALPPASPALRSPRARGGGSPPAPCASRRAWARPRR